MNARLEWHFWATLMKMQIHQRYLNIPGRKNWLRLILFLQDGTVVDAGGYEIYAIVPGLDCKISIYPTQVTEEGEYLEDLNNPWYMGQK